jgi:hypothetical protein
MPQTFQPLLHLSPYRTVALLQTSQVLTASFHASHQHVIYHVTYASNAISNTNFFILPKTSPISTPSFQSPYILSFFIVSGPSN